MKIKLTLLFLLCIGMSHSSFAQELEYNVQSSKVVKIGKTLPISDLATMPVIDPEKKKLYKKNRQAPENFKGRGTSKVNRPGLEHQGPDPIRQSTMGAKQVAEPLVNIDGLFNSFGSPHDPSGDIGLNYYIQAINATEIGVFDKDGTLVTEFTGNTLWTPFGGNGAGDPIILFDEMSQRWLITEFAFPRNMFIAISDTEDPLGTYTVYDFVTPSFPDYPKFAIWPNAIIITTNEGGPGELHNYFVNREELLAGADEVTMQRIEITGNTNTEAGFYVSTPLDFNGDMLPGDDALPTVMRINDSSWGDVPEDVLELYTFEIDWADELNTVVNNSKLVTTPFDSYPCAQEVGGIFPCAPQPSGNGLDAIPEVIMNIPQYRNFGTHESMVLSFITDATDGENISAIRWMELRRTDADWTIYQEGTYSPDNLHRYMCSIAIDKNGNIGLAYNVSSDEVFAGIRYTGRFANDPLGEMTVEEVVVVEGINNISSGSRFGDYAQMGVDPTNGATFWYTSEYAGNGNNNSKTRIVAFQLQKSNFDASPLSIISPVSSSSLSDSETVTVEVSNRGINTIENLQIGLLIEDAVVETFDLPIALAEDETYTHTFDANLDMSAFGDYRIGTFTNFDLDELTSNDTIQKVVSHIPALDGSLTGSSITSCNENTSSPVFVENKGLETITEVEFDVRKTGGASLGTVMYNKIIFPGETNEFIIPLENLEAGVNEYEIEVLSINGMVDQVPANNVTIVTVDFSEGFIEYSLLLNLDDFPEETTWTLEDTDNLVLATGGPYSEDGAEIRASFCLEEDKCYVFTILDSANDGICCGWGIGNYQIIDGMGNVVFNSNGEFGGSEITDFCAGESCVLDTDIEIVGSTDDNDGIILISVTGGVEPYSYSIDGGETFQDDPMFDGLASGDYQVVVISADGNCIHEEEVNVPLVLSIAELDGEYNIVVSPNPGTGRFEIAISDYESSDYTMQMQVIDASGKRIQEIPLQKYSNVYRGEISLVGYPSGIYYLRYMDAGIKHMSKVIKL